eukprot:jgi/Mesen1/8344/ME000462S07788
MAPRDIVNNALNEDLLVNILQRIDDRNDREACSLVCKRWLKLEGSLRRHSHVLRESVIPILRLRFPNLDSVDLSACTQVKDSDLLQLAESFQERLKVLNLAGNKGVTHVGMQALGRLCPELQELTLTNCTGLTDSAFVALAKCTSLKVLRLASCRTLSDMSLACLAAGCKRLEVLNLKWCVGVTDAGIALLAANCRALRSLDLSYSEVSGEGLAALVMLPQLAVLSLAACAYVDNEGVASLRQGCRSLKELDVSACQNVSDVGIVALAADNALPLHHLALSHCTQVTDSTLARLPTFSHLAVLKLNKCSITDSGLAFLGGAAAAADDGAPHTSCNGGGGSGRGCRALEELSLWRCEGVRDEGLAQVAAGCPRLRVLDLTCCREVSDEGLAAVAASCKSMRTLELEGCGRITHASLALLAASCTSLESINVTDCNVTDAGVEAIAQCTALRNLKIGISPQVTDAAIARIGASCHALREVDLYRCEEVGDVGVSALAGGCPELRVVNLSYCTRVGDDSLRGLARCRLLHNLELRGCRLVSSAGLAAVAGGCARLTELDVKECTGLGDEGLLAVALRCPRLRQINLSFCNVGNAGLLAVAALPCMRNMKLVHCRNVTIEAMVRALVACAGLKKLKAVASLRRYVPAPVVAELEARGCKLRWLDKPVKPDPRGGL